ncbi:MAG: alpha/beta fold hydrolase [Bryobacteraceae bacterium]
MPRLIESLFIDGPAGRLEALLEEPEHDDPREAALVCHPHPQHGGTMHNKVVYRMARGLRHAGAVVLRFNYRGVHLSEGVYDNGDGETDDARAALAVLRQRYPDLPFSVAAFSFGSRIALRLGCEPPHPRRIIAAGLPSAYHESTRCTVPRVFIQSTQDQYGPREAMQKYFDSLEEPKKLIWVEARDHFFSGALDAFEKACGAVL